MTESWFVPYKPHRHLPGNAMDLTTFIYQKFGLLLTGLAPLGLHSRGNLFEAKDENNEYVIKLECAEQLERITTSIAIATLLEGSVSISSSRFIRSLSGESFSIWMDKAVTVQYKEKLSPLLTAETSDLGELGRGVAEFHLVLKDAGATAPRSDFYQDFMFGVVPLAQNKGRLAEIERFYELHSPDYSGLSHGIIHNDLHLENVLLRGSRYFFLDFEHAKWGPLISDIGVLVLDLWEDELGAEDYLCKLEWLLKGYEELFPLTGYERESVLLFSLRYLLSDENWYTYWASNGNPDVLRFIPALVRRQNLLFTLVGEVLQE